jgi:hypothetical protein
VQSAEQHDDSSCTPVLVFRLDSGAHPQKVRTATSRDQPAFLGDVGWIQRTTFEVIGLLAVAYAVGAWRTSAECSSRDLRRRARLSHILELLDAVVLLPVSTLLTEVPPRGLPARNGRLQEDRVLVLDVLWRNTTIIRDNVIEAVRTSHIVRRAKEDRERDMEFILVLDALAASSRPVLALPVEPVTCYRNCECGRDAQQDRHRE